MSPGINRGDPYEFAEESSASSQQTKPSSVSHDDQDLFSPGTARVSCLFKYFIWACTEVINMMSCLFKYLI